MFAKTIILVFGLLSGALALQRHEGSSYEAEITWLGESRRNLASNAHPTRLIGGSHARKLGFSVKLGQFEDVTIDLDRADDILGSTFTHTTVGVGGVQTHVGVREDIDHCFYKGTVKEHERYSRVVVSTCTQQGLFGFAQIGKEYFNFSPGSGKRRLQIAPSDGHNMEVVDEGGVPIPGGGRNSARSVPKAMALRSGNQGGGGAVNRTIELLLASDFSRTDAACDLTRRVTDNECATLNDKRKEARARALLIAIATSTIYENIDTDVFNLNVQVVAYLDFDSQEAETEALGDYGTDIYALLNNWTDFRDSLGSRFNSDISHILTAQDLSGTTAGVAYLDTTCDPYYDTGVNEDKEGGFQYSAETVAHEIGHNMGLDHDSEYEKGNGCDDSIFIMAAFGASSGKNFERSFKSFSSCSISELETHISDSFYFPCIETTNNESPITVDSCGNNIVESGEECDDGLDGSANCFENCTLKAGKQCAFGLCCNITTGQILPQNTQCRSQIDLACDVADTCDGVSSECPDVHVDDFTPCGGGANVDGLCYTGICRSTQLQCEALGRSSTCSADESKDDCSSFNSECGLLWCRRCAVNPLFCYHNGATHVSDGTPCVITDSGSSGFCLDSACVALPTNAPTLSPTSAAPTELPTSSPTQSPTTPAPTQSPTTSAPTQSPTTGAPTESPTLSPTKNPTTSSPTVHPTLSPTTNPTKNPTTSSPTVSPTLSPTANPTTNPTVNICLNVNKRNCARLAFRAECFFVNGDGCIQRPSCNTLLSEAACTKHKAKCFFSNNACQKKTPKPTRLPTSFPTRKPTVPPTPFPTRNPTAFPTSFPTRAPNSICPDVSMRTCARKFSAECFFVRGDGCIQRPSCNTLLSKAACMKHKAKCFFFDNACQKKTPKPTRLPTSFPTRKPTVPPTPFPTRNPTVPPTSFPTRAPNSICPDVSMRTCVGKFNAECFFVRGDGCIQRPSCNTLLSKAACTKHKAKCFFFDNACQNKTPKPTRVPTSFPTLPNLNCTSFGSKKTCHSRINKKVCEWRASGGCQRPVCSEFASKGACRRTVARKSMCKFENGTCSVSEEVGGR